MAETDALYDPNARFQRTEVPLVSPGICVVCGSATKPVIDFRANVNFYGAILMCVECIAEASALAGMVRRQHLEAAQERLSQSFEDELNQRELKAITHEQYELLALAFGSIFSGDVPANHSGDDLVLGETTSEYATLFDDPIGDDRVEQDSEPANAGSSKASTESFSL